VVYSSDHGDFVGGHGLPEKQACGHNFYEETLRVPLIFNYPGKIASGAVRQDLVELVDLYPTLLDLCGIAPPERPATGRAKPGGDAPEAIEGEHVLLTLFNSFFVIFTK